jgi:uncharacterized membrane protein
MRREESAYVAFGQYWLQARHQETARLWMTNVMALVFALLLAMIAWQGLVYWYMAAFGLSLSLFGFFVNHSMRVLSVRYARVAGALMDTELGMGDYRRFIEGGDKTGFKGAWENLWSLHMAFVLFYCFGIAGWSALLTMTQNTPLWFTTFTFVLMVVISLVFYFVILWPRERAAETQPLASVKRQRDRDKKRPSGPTEQ